MRRLLALATTTLVAGLAFMLAQPAEAQSRLQIIQERGTLRVGTTGDFNPMSVRDPATNTYKGFDIDAMEQLAADLGVGVEWVPAEWATLVAGVASDQYDIFSGASLNMGRARTVGYSIPYFQAGTVPLTLDRNADRFSSWDDINQPGVKVAVSLGTVFEEQARAHFPNAEIVSVQSPATGFQEVLAGRSDVTITSNVEASSLVQRFENMVWLDVPARNLRPFAYPLPQDDFAWINFVNSWVTLKTTEGFYDALRDKWMPN